MADSADSRAGRDTKTPIRFLSENKRGVSVTIALVFSAITAMISIGALPKLSDIQTRSASASEHKAMKEEFDKDLHASEELAKTREQNVLTLIQAVQTSQAATNTKLDAFFKYLLEHPRGSR